MALGRQKLKIIEKKNQNIFDPPRRFSRPTDPPSPPPPPPRNWLAMTLKYQALLTRGRNQSKYPNCHCCVVAERWMDGAGVSQVGVVQEIFTFIIYIHAFFLCSFEYYKFKRHMMTIRDEPMMWGRDRA